jgi:hypothetical protein
VPCLTQVLGSPGFGERGKPALNFQSAGLTPAKCTLISTSLFLGTGRGPFPASVLRTAMETNRLHLFRHQELFFYRPTCKDVRGLNLQPRMTKSALRQLPREFDLPTLYRAAQTNRADTDGMLKDAIAHGIVAEDGKRRDTTSSRTPWSMTC